MYFNIFKWTLSLAKKSDIKAQKGYLEFVSVLGPTRSYFHTMAKLPKESVITNDNQIPRLIKEDENDIKYMPNSLFWFIIEKCKPIRVEVATLL